jgi:hypothetical protein
MDTLQVQKSDALKAFKQADDRGKQLLESLFGKLVPENITDKVKTFEDACEVLNIDSAVVLPPINPVLSKDVESIYAYIQLIIITRALNEGWEPDWDDDDEYKYYPWFYMQSGSGFRLGYVGVYFGHSFVGSRLCFQKEEVAKYAATQFLDIYKQFMTL